MTVIFDEAGLRRAIVRLAHEIEERSKGLENVVLVGVKRGGEIVAQRLAREIARFSQTVPPCAGIDIGITRDDLVSDFFVPEATQNAFSFSVDQKTVVLCDDVLHTGRSAVAGIEALFKIGRPAKICFLALVDRGGREVPIRADFVGKNVPTSHKEYVRVEFTELGANADGLYITKCEDGNVES